MKKLILFGDSLIANFGKRKTTAIESRTDYDVYNCATGGWDTNDGVKKAAYIASLNPDAVVMSFGTNDCSPWRVLDIEVVKANIGKLLEIFSGSKIVFLLPPPVTEEKLDAASPGHNGQVYSNKTIKEYSDAIKGVLDQNNAGYIDRAIFEQLKEGNQDYHEEDGVHFNDLGYQTVIDGIIEVLN